MIKKKIAFVMAHSLVRISGGARNFIEFGQNFDRKFTCDVIYK